MAKISVIIPAYNAETTLRTAVESILSQQVPELEIIIVNDGSTDGTDRLCHALASEYPCIHVITQKNAGICAARNRGMEAAIGEYITFCDDDDLFWQGALRLLLQTAEDTRADLVRGGYELLRQRPDAAQKCLRRVRAGGALRTLKMAVDDLRDVDRLADAPIGCGVKDKVLQPVAAPFIEAQPQQRRAAVEGVPYKLRAAVLQKSTVAAAAAQRYRAGASGRVRLLGKGTVRALSLIHI